MPDDINMQVQWFDHQFVRAREFQTEQNFLNERRWLHTRGFHTAGIVDGLQVSRVGGAPSDRYEVAPGWGVDDNGGEMIVLAPPGGAEAGPRVHALPGEKIWLRARRESDAPSIDPGLDEHDTRWNETPEVLVRAGNATTGTGPTQVPPNALLLAAIKQDGSVDLSVRHEVQIRDPDTIRSRDIHEADNALDAGLPSQDTNSGFGVKTGHITDEAVDSAKLRGHPSQDARRAVTTNHIRDAAVTEPKIGTDQVSARTIAPNNVTDVELRAAASDANDGQRAVTRDHLRNNAVTRAKIMDGEVTETKIGTDQVGTRAIATGSVTDVELRAAASDADDAQRAVTDTHIRNGAVRRSKIADREVVSSKIALSAVTSGHVAGADGSSGQDVNTGSGVKEGHIQDGAITNAKVRAGTLTADRFAAGQIPVPVPENWRDIGAPGQPAFENGWHNENPVGEVVAGFYKDPWGVVHLKGVIADGTWNTRIFVLPDGYRPAKSVIMIGFSGGFQRAVPAQVIVRADGSFELHAGSGSASLDGLTFRAGEA